jgi:hypothetical protein
MLIRCDHEWLSITALQDLTRTYMFKHCGATMADLPNWEQSTIHTTNQWLTLQDMKAT